MRKLFLLALAALVAVCYSLPAKAAMEQGDKKFEVSGEVRVRGDYADNPTDLDSDLPDSGAVWPWRVRAAIHGQFTRNVSAHVEFQNFGFGGDDTSGFPLVSGNTEGVGGETLLYQGWLELGDIGGGSFDLRLGRQELVYGSEMLLGDFDFYNGLSYDAAKAAWQYKKWSLDVFGAKLLESASVPFSTTDIFPTASSPADINLWGAYAVFKAPKKIGFDAYALYLQDQTDEHRWTFGGRVYSKWDSNWSWSGEAALQTGEFEASGATPPTDIAGAFGLEGELAYQWRKSKIRPRVYGRIAMYTGDDDDSAESEAFNPLFMDFHARNGYFDLFRGTNLNVIQAGVSWSGKEERHVFGVDLLNFTSNEETVGTGVPGVATDVGEDALGTELDLYYKYAYSKNVNITAAIAQFSPGDLFDGVSATADSSPEITASADDSAMRVYVNTRLRF